MVESSERLEKADEIRYSIFMQQVLHHVLLSQSRSVQIGIVHKLHALPRLVCTSIVPGSNQRFPSTYHSLSQARILARQRPAISLLQIYKHGVFLALDAFVVQFGLFVNHASCIGHTFQSIALSFFEAAPVVTSRIMSTLRETRRQEKAKKERTLALLSSSQTFLKIKYRVHQNCRVRTSFDIRENS